jgi:hypothetical protein
MNRIRRLQLASRAEESKLQDQIYASFSTTGLYRKIGNVTYSILTRRERPHVVRFILEEEIERIVAERLAKLVAVEFLFTFNIWENVTLIPSFTDAASLEDILNVQAEQPFNSEHSKMLADDVSTPYHLRMQY